MGYDTNEIIDPWAPRLSDVRKRIKEIVQGAKFPLYPNVRADFPNGPPKIPPPPGVTGKVTNCGEFPGWVMKQLGGRGAPADLWLKFADQWGTYSLTAPMTGWEQWAKKVEAKRGPAAKGTIWVPYKPGMSAVPQPGDIYVLHGWTKTEPKKYGFAHVGIVFEITGDQWTTADAGQGDGFGGCYNKRAVTGGKSFTASYGDPAKDKRPDSGSRDLRGWVDVGNLLAGWQPA